MKSIGWGGVSGTIVGATCAALVLIPRAMSSGAYDLPVAPGIVAGIYIGGGVVGGLVAGVLSRFATHWTGAAIVGWLAMFPIVLAFTVIESGGGSSILRDSLVVSLVLGLPLGVIAKKLVKEIDPFGRIE